MANRTSGQRDRATRTAPSTNVSDRAPPRDDARATRNALLLGALLIIVTIIAYVPSLRGGWIWDDPDHVVGNLNLRDAHGLYATWFEPTSLPQWYPLVHTTFWFEYQLFGPTPLAYKLTNLALHIATALLLWRLLARLSVPGAFLASLIFALHPVHVESVAWITERKNVLSAFFYVLAAMVCVTRVFQLTVTSASAKTRELKWWMNRWYWLATLLFICALLSKTVTASLPAAMLLVAWWKRGRLTRDDFLPMLPWFVVGAAMGLFTGYLRRANVGAVGAEWVYGPTWITDKLARLLIAAHAVWFYTGKLIWPHPLAFMYERWEVTLRDPFAWAMVAGAIAVPVVLLLLRNRIGRGPVVVVLFFGGTLFPALGFFNVLPHRYSFVADHFQYIASIGITTLVAALIASAVKRFIRAQQTSAVTIFVVSCIIALTLARINWNQGKIYKDEETLWKDTMAKTPSAWISYTRLGVIAAAAGRDDDATRFHERAVELGPQAADTWFNLGSTRATQGRFDEAVVAFNNAIDRAQPKNPAYLYSLVGLARIELEVNKNSAAAEQFVRRALDARHDFPPANLYLGKLLLARQERNAAVDRLRVAARGMPESFEAHYLLGRSLLELRQPDEAAANLAVASELNPQNADALAFLAFAQVLLNRQNEARVSAERALQLHPTHAMAQLVLKQLEGR